MRKYVVEFIGTFFLVITICMTVLGDLGSFAPIAIGSMLMVMIYAGGHISGAHFNPAVTLAVYLRGKCPAADIFPYILAQIIGGLLAAVIAAVLLGSMGVEDPTPKVIQPVPALIAEFLGTFALCYVILHSATAKGTEGNSFYGLAIGFTVLACAFAFGAISGGAFNPAVAFGISLANMLSWGDIWIFLIANFAAGAAAAYVFLFVNGKD